MHYFLVLGSLQCLFMQLFLYCSIETWKDPSLRFLPALFKALRATFISYFE